MTGPILQLAGVDKRFGRTRVLSGVDLEVHAGEFVILIGGSGSGKTTLLRLAGGLEASDHGVISLRGAIVDDRPRNAFIPPEHRRLGMVFQDYALWPHMTSVENVEAALRGAPATRRRAALALLDQLDMAPLAGRLPAELSGGQQQRVGLARALAADPDLLLLDEPLSSLDVDVRERMRDHIRTMLRARGTAALLVTHDPIDAWRLADRVAVLEHGRIAQTATPEQLFARPATARIARFTDAIGSFRVVMRREGNITGFDWAGALQPATTIGVAAGATGQLYIRPCGVRSGPIGAAAQLIGRTLEAGGWRASWRMAASGWTVLSNETAPPPTETRLSLNADHCFIYLTEDLI